MVTNRWSKRDGRGNVRGKRKAKKLMYVIVRSVRHCCQTAHKKKLK